MCGRATLTTPADEVARLFDVDPVDLGPPRFNIAPSQPMTTVRDEAGKRALAVVRWGLVPWWAKPDEVKSIASRCVQARAESAPRSPAFRDAFQHRRCLVVVDGFFEWKTLPDGRRVPHHVKQSGRRAFAIAGLWETWHTDEQRIESCAVITTRAGGPMRELHDRMPLVLAPEEWDGWLHGSADDAATLLVANDARGDGLVATPVSTWVNDVRHDDPRCIEPAVIPAGQMDFGFAESAAARKRR